MCVCYGGVFRPVSKHLIRRKRKEVLEERNWSKYKRERGRSGKGCFQDTIRFGRDKYITQIHRSFFSLCVEVPREWTLSEFSVTSFLFRSFLLYSLVRVLVSPSGEYIFCWKIFRSFTIGV